MTTCRDLLDRIEHSATVLTTLVRMLNDIFPENGKNDFDDCAVFTMLDKITLEIEVMRDLAAQQPCEEPSRLQPS